MMFAKYQLSLLLSSALLGSVSAETILGVTVYSRHGDRKHPLAIQGQAKCRTKPLQDPQSTTKGTC
jgi:hypothetical protein